ncbi:lipopolysaccharide biosynthesis protein [Prevotella copri]|uniref:MATE family efflux transporter n=1 Tax=Segatella copri TaxID=165179 RepID=UPI001C384B43|nr:MATE family efflux transporter [Segatella copri]MBV3431134.1 lipopolysaccharide biosynthesis protein [Segatella copri]
MSSQTTDNNKRIAKNTLLLYFRMLLMMFVTLFTSREVLDKLGVSDYGIYNVVGGVVAMLGFLNSSMSNAVQRYLSFEIGKNNEAGVNRIFNVSLFAHAGIAVFVFIVMEIVGVWYLNTHMNIPAERMDAANWVLQCSIFTTLFTIVQVPYNAIIISKEQMGIYAYISILEVVLKLLVVYMLAIGNFDKLKLYSVLIMVVTIGIVMIYRCYCTRKYKEAKFKFVKDWNLLKQIVGFASWNMLGELAWVFTGQGVNIILNSFFGPVVNAARGLAEQVNGAVNRFVANFQTAVNPQLIKNYASDQLGEMKTLLFRSTRFSYYLLLALSLPIILKMDFILHLWLKEVPDYTTGFCQLVLVSSLVSTLSNFLAQVARAYGKIRNYQIIVSIFLFLNFPLSYIVLKFGCSPLSTMFVNIGVNAMLLFVRLRLTNRMIQMTYGSFIRNVLFPVIIVTSVALVIPLTIYFMLDNSIISFIIVCLVSFVSVGVSTYALGMNANERQYILAAISKIITKIK